MLDTNRGEKIVSQVALDLVLFQFCWTLGKNEFIRHKNKNTFGCTSSLAGKVAKKQTESNHYLCFRNLTNVKFQYIQR